MISTLNSTGGGVGAFWRVWLVRFGKPFECIQVAEEMRTEAGGQSKAWGAASTIICADYLDSKDLTDLDPDIPLDAASGPGDDRLINSQRTSCDTLPPKKSKN